MKHSDTRVLLCSSQGDVFPMTENHHADARVESIRLRRMMGSALIADSFGETRYLLFNPVFHYSLNYVIDGWVLLPILEGRLPNFLHSNISNFYM